MGMHSVRMSSCDDDDDDDDGNTMKLSPKATAPRGTGCTPASSGDERTAQGVFGVKERPEIVKQRYLNELETVSEC